MNAVSQQLRSALWVSTSAVGEADALIRFFADPDGALTTRARGLQKATSKLAHVLLPADELSVRFASGRGQTPSLTGVSTRKNRPYWRKDLRLLALYWFMVECAFLGSGTEKLNRAVFDLITSILDTHPGQVQQWACATAYSFQLLKLHGLLCDFDHCVRNNQSLDPTIPVFMLPSGEGFISREAYNKYYARTGGGLLRLAPEVLVRWRNLLHQPISLAVQISAESVDAAVAIHLTAQQISQSAGCSVNSATFLVRQWALPSLDDLIKQSLGSS